VGKGAARAVPTRGHASLCPPYANKQTNGRGAPRLSETH